MVDEDTKALVVSGTADTGQALVRTIAQAGGTVGFTYDSSESAAEDLLNELPDEGHVSWQCDVSDADRTTEVVDEAVETFERVDAVFFTIGVISRSAIDEIDPDEWQNHFDANVTGAYNLLRAVGPQLEEQGDGTFVAVSASQGILNSPNLSAYDASKRGLEALVQEAAREYGSAGVRANVVAPGFIRDPNSLSEDQIHDLYEQQQYDRLTTPQDVANACLFLCSDEAPTITGAILPVDAGLSL